MKNFLKIIVLLLVGSLLVYFFTWKSPKDKAIKIFNDNENIFNSSQKILLEERKRLGRKKWIIFRGKSRPKADVSQSVSEQINKLLDVGVVSIRVTKGIVYFYTDGFLSHETAIVFCDSKKLSEVEDMPMLRENWYIHDI